MAHITFDQKTYPAGHPQGHPGRDVLRLRIWVLVVDRVGSTKQKQIAEFRFSANWHPRNFQIWAGDRGWDARLLFDVGSPEDPNGPEQQEMLFNFSDEKLRSLIRSFLKQKANFSDLRREVG